LFLTEEPLKGQILFGRGRSILEMSVQLVMSTRGILFSTMDTYGHNTEHEEEHMRRMAWSWASRTYGTVCCMYSFDLARQPSHQL